MANPLLFLGPILEALRRGKPGATPPFMPHMPSVGAAPEIEPRLPSEPPVLADSGLQASLGQMYGNLRTADGQRATGRAMPPQPGTLRLPSMDGLPGAYMQGPDDEYYGGNEGLLPDALEAQQPASPFGNMKPGTLTLPSRFYKAPEEPQYQDIPEIYRRDIGEDARGASGAANEAGFLGALLGGGRAGALAAIKASRGYMQGRDKVAQQEQLQNNADTSRVLRLNSQAQQKYGNKLNNLRYQMQADNQADANTVRAFNANSQDQQRQRKDQIAAQGLDLKRQIATVKTDQDARRLAGQLARWAADAQFLGVRIADIDNDNQLNNWLAKNAVARGVYNAETSRLMALNGFTLGKERNEIAATNNQMDYNLGMQRLEQQGEGDPEKDLLSAGKGLFALQQRVAGIDKQIGTVRSQIQQGKPTQQVDPATGQMTWVYTPWSPQERAQLEQQVQSLLSAKATAAQVGQMLRTQMGETPGQTPANQPQWTPPAHWGEDTPAPPPGKGPLAPVILPSNDMGAFKGTRFDPNAKKMSLPSAKGQKFTSKSGNKYTVTVK